MQLLTMQARRAATEARTPDMIERAAALALESIALAYKDNRPGEADAVETARNMLTKLPLLILTQGSFVGSLAVFPDGRLASGSDDGTIKLWPKDFQGEPAILRHGSSVQSLAILPDGRLASGGEDGSIKLWLVDEKKLLAALCLRAGRNLSKDEWATYIGRNFTWQPSCRDVPSNWRTPNP
jgi:WD40 repeat protein